MYFNKKHAFIPKKKKREAQLIINFNQLIWSHKTQLQAFRHLEIAPKGEIMGLIWVHNALMHMGNFIREFGGHLIFLEQQQEEAPYAY
jgi:hypothetical protein